MHEVDGNSIKLVLHTDPLPALPEWAKDMDAADVLVVVDGNWKVCDKLSN